MFGSRIAYLMIFPLLICSPAMLQESSVKDPTDIRVELRSATGSNRFRLGEVIPLEVLVSSSAPNRYLEPCTLFRESCFGFPRCRFFTDWSFGIVPESGWTDIGWHGCMTAGGPSYEVKSGDLSAEPKKYSYTLTNKFRFDKPGEYTVRLSLTVGLDDETNQIIKTLKPNSVRKTAEIVLDIVPAGAEWQASVIQKGIDAWAAGPPKYANPTSPAYLQYQQDTAPLCNLGTPEAARALVGLLSQERDVSHCLNINPNIDTSVSEMRRLLVDPNVGVRPIFFAEYAALLSRSRPKIGGIQAATIQTVNELRDTLVASLPKKNPGAMVTSLETVLLNPMSGHWVEQGSAYDLHEPYAKEVIAMAAANFDRFSEQTQEALLDTGWEHLRSPLMLSVVRQKAEAGNGQALLRWLELDPVPATSFMRQEVVRPAPRFSSYYLRLPDATLPDQERQIAANFVALDNTQDLEREATLLHRYATRTVSPAVLPFIDAHLAEWPCSLQIPVLAYLLKVSPGDEAPRVEQVLQNVKAPSCPRGEFFPSLGFVEPSAVLERPALKQIETGTPLARDAAEYLKLYGSTAVKPAVWEQLSRWSRRFTETGAEERLAKRANDWNDPSKRAQILDDSFQNQVVTTLREAYVEGQGWVLSAEEERQFTALAGEPARKGLACSFSCSSSLSIGPVTGTYLIRGMVNEPVWPREARIDYLMPTQRLHYAVNQYHCASLEAFKQKLLQFPAGSRFNIGWSSSEIDRAKLVELKDFLRSHGYLVLSQ